MQSCAFVVLSCLVLLVPRFFVCRTGGGAATFLDLRQRSDAHLSGEAVLPSLRHPGQPCSHRLGADDGLRQQAPSPWDGLRHGVRAHAKGDREWTGVDVWCDM